MIALAQQYPAEYAGSVDRCVALLSKVSAGEINPDYEYHKTPNPWLQVKCLRLLQCYDAPTRGTPLASAADKVLMSILLKGAHLSDGSRSFNALNALAATIVEAINTAVYYDANSEIVQRAIPLLGTMVGHKEANLRYMGLEGMATVAYSADSIGLIQKHTDIVMQALKDRDISIRRSALDLLYCMCDQSNAKRIVDEYVFWRNLRRNWEEIEMFCDV